MLVILKGTAAVYPMGGPTLAIRYLAHTCRQGSADVKSRDFENRSLCKSARDTHLIDKGQGTVDSCRTCLVTGSSTGGLCGVPPPLHTMGVLRPALVGSNPTAHTEGKKRRRAALCGEPDTAHAKVMGNEAA